MNVEIWSDVVCPWCYIGKKRFEAALARFEHREELDIVWRSFELDPAASHELSGDYPSRLARKYGVSVEEARAMIERVTRAGAGVGIEFRFDIGRPGNTFDAHRVIHLAGDHGVQVAMVQRLFAAAFTEGRPIGDRDTLAALATEVGIDADEAATMLDSDRYAAEVRADEQEARALGITAVPFFVFDRTHGVAGAQSPEVLLEVLRQAWHHAAQALSQ
jgi:predicted DsbA family dithiol-disulfide isomerase